MHVHNYRSSWLCTQTVPFWKPWWKLFCLYALRDGQAVWRKPCDYSRPYREMRSADIEYRGGVNTGARLRRRMCCFIGINLNAAKDYHSAIAKLNALDEVVEAYYTTGVIILLSWCVSLTKSCSLSWTISCNLIAQSNRDANLTAKNPINRNVNP